MFDQPVKDKLSAESDEKKNVAPLENFQHLSDKVHSDTMYFVDGFVREFGLYPEILDDMRRGKGVVELRKRVLLRAIDETWVTAIEDSLTALDELIRKPSHFIKETERILPIELTKAVSNRSIKHLAQHTDYISKVEGDTVIPSKLLNVFRDETNQTYENKFVNTLLNRLFVFVRRRYDAAVEAGQDVKNTSLDFSNEFSHGDQKGKVHLHVELEEPPKDGEVEKNYIFTSDLWRRVERLNRICTDYMSSAFVNDMGKSYINPPVMRTNAILKNKSLRQCLYLWEFIESYENTGFTTVVDDTLLDVDEAYIRELYSTMAMEYLLFRHRMEKGFDADDELARSHIDEPLRPEIVEDLSPATAADFAVHVQAIDETQGERTAEQTEILQALEAALLADEVMRRRVALEDANDGYEYSLMARLVLAQEPAQTFYTQLKNLLLSYKGVKSRISWKHDNYVFGKKPCARLAIKGKTLCIYLPLNPLDEKYAKYSVIDKSGVSAHKNRPFCMRIRSRRALNRAVTLVQEVMQKLEAGPLANAMECDYHYPLQSREDLLKQGLIRKRSKKETESTQKGRNFNSNAFMAKLVLAQEPAQTYYTQLKNRLLSYRKVKSRVSWKYDSFNCGRTLCARIAIRGKTLMLCLALDPAVVDAERYGTEDMSGRAQYNQTPVAKKIRSPLALKRALELVDLTMQNLGIKQLPNYVEQDYRQKLLERAELIAKGWIKVAQNPAVRIKFAKSEKGEQEDLPETEANSETEATSETDLPIVTNTSEIKNDLVSTAGTVDMETVATDEVVSHVVSPISWTSMPAKEKSDAVSAKENTEQPPEQAALIDTEEQTTETTRELPFLTNENDLAVDSAKQKDENENSNETEEEEKESLLEIAETIEADKSDENLSETDSETDVADETPSGKTPDVKGLDEDVVFDAQIDGDFELLNKPIVDDESSKKKGFFGRLFNRSKNKRKDGNKDE